MAGLNFADIFETVVDTTPDAPALVVRSTAGDEVRLTFAELDARANRLAHAFLDQGIGPGDHIGCHLYDGNQFVEATLAAFKVRAVPVNVNFRYVDEELGYLFDNADLRLVVTEPDLEIRAERAAKGMERDCPVVVADDRYETLLSARPATRPEVAGRGPDDLYGLWTGGTTGMPKGVMWRQEDLFKVLGGGGNLIEALPPLETPADAGERALASETREGSVLRLVLAAAPLMHATAQFTALSALTGAGAIATLPSHRLNTVELWSEVERLGVTGVTIVGQAFAQPMLQTLNAHPGRWDLSKLRVINSSGTVWSHENKQGLLKHAPHITLFDSLGSSEAVGIGGSNSTAGQEAETAKFALGPNTAAFTEDGRRIQPGSGERGLLALAGFLPVGYYKDPEKSAKTFREFEGRRWSVPGDFATVEADGSLTLLGRGSQVINTGGEKVFPEEVEEALKRHPSVHDAVVVGVPDERFGERICAVVELAPGAPAPTLEQLSKHVRAHLADYKAPRELVLAPVARSPNGKVDYKAAKALALERLKITA